jgi:hypothetical protein
LPNLTAYQLLEACREPGCPVCRVEQRSVERYLDNQLYENVNSPKWRDKLRASLGFCHEHAWLAVNQRLGDALGFSIIYRDVVNHVLSNLDRGTAQAPRGLSTILRQVPEGARTLIENILSAMTPRKRCPACEHRDETTRATISILLEELKSSEMRDALQASDGLCLPHLRQTLEHVQDVTVSKSLLDLHRGKLERLRYELEEFIRKNDYQLIGEGFGEERDAWLRAIAMVAGSRKEA